MLHAEHRLMQQIVRQEYYIPRLKPKIKKCIFMCKICTMHKQKMRTQIMAAIPPERCNFALPFTITGVDFAGPFQIKASMLRSPTLMKGYVAVFVCFTTKAVHLELCTNLTTEAFLAAFARFVGRRGFPSKIMSDNGKTFIGAQRATERQFVEFIQQVSPEIVQKYAPQGINWQFIPPSAPHMGGLWKSAQYGRGYDIPTNENRAFDGHHSTIWDYPNRNASNYHCSNRGPNPGTNHTNDPSK
ncbi:uncharacterized protein LOC128921440 [Zeugodacus cucurbitae]|uniref:uncharacterized protein LOC128921440 n=1 Tax=Zeugodacus cucurbitae TaxID=28588 RepID=UPI0023D8FE09|nr:uncharacterized protein LOC128921440 [Zeugodacus cucurbitae]